MAIDDRFEELNQYLMGWLGYFALADTPSVFKSLDMWIRRRLRMCLWKQWKLPRRKVKRLIALGVPKAKASSGVIPARDIGVFPTVLSWIER